MYMYVAYLQIDIGEEELIITGVDDSGVIGAGKHISDSRWSKQLQHDRLRTKNNLFTGT